MRDRTRREHRLDPVRWRRPGRSALLRSAVVAALIATSALLMWTGPGPPGPSPGPGALGPSPDPGASGPRPGPGAFSRTGPAPVPPTPGAGARPVVPPGLVGVPIRLAEPTALKLIHPGDHVDVFRVPETGGSPAAIATAALVLRVTGVEDPTTGGLLLALTAAEARRTVTSPAGGYAVLIRP